MTTTETKLPKSYTPAEHEPGILARWDEARAFHAEPTDPGEPYCILIPPPNVTAALHLGHAFNNTLQDILVRFHRMRGFNTLWMPGTDHAGIATQTVVEKRLHQQGKRRIDFSRDEFIALVQQWKDEYEATITEQLKWMGCSCDYDRQRFTMDDMCARAVREAFFRLFKEGLIYRGKRLVNWDPVSQTALADDEVEMKEVAGKMYYLRYPLVHPSTNKDDPKDCQEVTWSELRARGYPVPDDAEHEDENNAWLTVATTRPETYLGDTAVAVNPTDPRAKALKDLCVQLPIVGRVIPIVRDDYVVMPDASSSEAKAQFATGFLKVTPAHDPNDWEIGQRHDLDVINVMAPDASVSDQHGWQREQWNEDGRIFVGLSREAARDKVLAEFKAHGLLEHVRDYTHSVGHSYRSHVPIEPYLSDQWYVKVTDDRLVGEAQRALADDQYEGAKPPRETSRDREGADTTCFFITYSCYANWLHGDERGSVDRDHNLPGTPYVLGDEAKERREFESLRFPAMTLDEAQREAVQDAIVEVCEHRGWRLIALHVRPTHVHCVVHADTTPERVMNDFKSYATRRLRERSLVDEATKVWTRHGSTRYLNDDASLIRAAEYVIDEQGASMRPLPIDAREENGARNPLPHGRGSYSADADYDGAMRFYPARYAKMYQSWHDNLRDWCISRQLWWGHRIPVWSKTGMTEHEADDACEDLRTTLQGGDCDGSAHISSRRVQEGSQYAVYACLIDVDDYAIREVIEKGYGFTQDPDVLDTWFSSGLWPLSTMGWPTPDDYPDTPGLLDTFNPTSVLCTAREIITLWVSRMTMFNRFFTEDHRVPFKDVYIHAMIQDGHGQKMSKSLGNGVDPRDIIHSHGADALRYTLTQMATPTQDVRMPVDTVCPHCTEMFHPKEFTTPGGYRVAEPIQTCPKCSKSMVTVYGSASGEATPDDTAPLARNTSSKFDLGRNFCNKLWNATRFALTYLQDSAAGADTSIALADLSIPDRWIINRLHKTLHVIEDALAEYQFNVYADAMYDFIWRDFCDWYLELIKPTVKESPVQQQVLRTVLNAAMRLLHPIAPFVTETLWPHISAVGEAGIEGVELPSSELLATAAWPSIKCSVHDKESQTTFERVQDLTNAIRHLRSERKVKPRKQITLHATENMRALIVRVPGVVETMAGLEAIEPIPAERPPGAIPLAFEGEEQLLSGLVDAVDVEAERNRLTKLIEEKRKAIGALNGRLSNESYVNKAPAHLVEQSRAQLAEANADLEAAQQALKSLEGG